MSHVERIFRLIGCVLASTSIVVPGIAAAKPAPAPEAHRFDVGGSIFAGSAKTICVIEGQWKDGEHFRFEAWDECSQMRMRRVAATTYRSARSLGNNQDFTSADIPAGAEVLELSNDFSSVLLFRDINGVMREILSRD